MLMKGVAMKKRLLILAAAVLLALVLAVPASASKPMEVKGTYTEGRPITDEVLMGNSCHVTSTFNPPMFFHGGIEAECDTSFESVTQGGFCPGRPGVLPESYHLWGSCKGWVLDKEGTFDLQCHRQFQPGEPETLNRCVIAGTGRDLVNLKGHVTFINWGVGEYTGEVHFAPDK
jgi:hypothetical protein